MMIHQDKLLSFENQRSEKCFKDEENREKRESSNDIETDNGFGIFRCDIDSLNQEQEVESNNDDDGEVDEDYLTTKTINILNQSSSSIKARFANVDYSTTLNSYLLPISKDIDVIESSSPHLASVRIQNNNFSKVTKALSNVFDSWDLLKELESRLDRSLLANSPGTVPFFMSNEASLSDNMKFGQSFGYSSIAERSSSRNRLVKRNSSNSSDEARGNRHDYHKSASFDISKNNLDLAPIEEVANQRLRDNNGDNTVFDDTRIISSYFKDANAASYQRSSSLKTKGDDKSVASENPDSRRNSMEDDTLTRASSASVCESVNDILKEKKDKFVEEEDDYVSLSQSQVFSLPFDPNRGQTIGEKLKRLTSSLSLQQSPALPNAADHTNDYSSGQLRYSNMRLEEELRRLKELVRSLQVENARLIDEKEKVLVLDKKERVERRSFQREYRKRFALLRRCIAEFSKEYKGVILNSSSLSPSEDSSETFQNSTYRHSFFGPSNS